MTPDTALYLKVKQERKSIKLKKFKFFFYIVIIYLTYLPLSTSHPPSNASVVVPIGDMEILLLPPKAHFAYGWVFTHSGWLHLHFCCCCSCLGKYWMSELPIKSLLVYQSSCCNLSPLSTNPMLAVFSHSANRIAHLAEVEDIWTWGFWNFPWFLLPHLFFSCSFSLHLCTTLGTPGLPQADPVHLCFLC